MPPDSAGRDATLVYTGGPPAGSFSDRGPQRRFTFLGSVAVDSRVVGDVTVQVQGVFGRQGWGDAQP